jgi:hypothetical protein
VLQIRQYRDGIPVGDNKVYTYLIDSSVAQRYHNMPVISIVTDSVSLFGYETGIYVPGQIYDLYGSWEWWGGGQANFVMRGEEWERRANLTFFEGDGTVGFQQDVGLRIHGGGTRVYPLKSLRVYARSEYGKSKINYRIFPNKQLNIYKRLVLSSNGSDFLSGTFNDVISAALIEHLDVDLQSSRPCVVFINGEYWGVHSLRDRLDQYYCENKFGADADMIDIFENNMLAEGDSTAYRELINYISNHDLSVNAYYDYVSAFIDINSFIDYNIAKQYLAIGDWPGNNTKWWRERKPGAKWRWFFYDNNAAMNMVDYNTIQTSLMAGGTTYPNPDWSTLVLRSLMKNDKFRSQYLQRFNFHIDNTFKPERLNYFIDSINNLYQPLLAEHISRWGYPLSDSIRNNQLNLMHTFASQRPSFIQLQLMDLLSINETIDLNSKTKIYISDNQIHVRIPENLIAKYYLYDVSGKCIDQGELSQSLSFIKQPGSSGLYIAKLIIGNDIFTHKVIIP